MTIKVLIKASKLLEALAAGPAERTISELASDAELHPATAGRILTTLEEIGFVAYSPTAKRYRLGVKLFQLGNQFARQSHLRGAAHPYRESLAEETGESVCLSMCTPARYVLPASISNVGAYAIAAALALLREQPELSPRPGTVRELFHIGADRGLLDGGTLDPHFRGDDGVPADAIVALVLILNTIVEQSNRTMDARPF